MYFSEILLVVYALVVLGVLVGSSDSIRRHTHTLGVALAVFTYESLSPKWWNEKTVALVSTCTALLFLLAIGSVPNTFPRFLFGKSLVA